jgi:pantothenate kinase-related protein Tda10
MELHHQRKLEIEKVKETLRSVMKRSFHMLQKFANPHKSFVRFTSTSINYAPSLRTQQEQQLDVRDNIKKGRADDCKDG